MTKARPVAEPLVGLRVDLPLGKALRAENPGHGAELAALTCIEHVLARADALHYLPDDRDVHSHGALPVPLVARLSLGGDF